VFADNDAKVSLVVGRFKAAEIVGGVDPKHAQSKRGTYFRTELSEVDKTFLNSQKILYFGDEPTTVGLV
jgi:hypothetical protein